MKKILSILFFVLALNCTHAQNKFSTATKRFLFDLNEVNRMYAKNNAQELLPEIFISNYSLYYKHGSYRIGVLCLLEPEAFNKEMFNIPGVHYSGSAGNVHSLRVDIQKVEELSSIPGVKLIDIGDPLSPDLIESRASTRADSVHLGLGGLSRAYTGKGVVIAIIDWGFDYTHPVFLDSTLNRFRIVRAWDQNKNSGPAPKGYDFGTAYETREDILSAEHDTLYVFGPMSHGTHVGGIAGGAGGGTRHIGVAPESDLIFISLRRDAPSLIDAITYIQSYSRSVGKPFVVNMSFGSHLGPHDGNDLKNIGIDAIAGRGRIFVGSAGNNGDSPFHLSHQFTGKEDTLQTVVNFNPVDEYFGQTLSMWGSENSRFRIRFLMVDAQNNIKVASPWYDSGEEPVVNEIYHSETDSIEIRITATAKFASNNKPNIRAEVRKAGNYKVVLQSVSSENEELHIWNNVRLQRRYTNWGVPLTANYPGAKAGDVHFGLGEPAGVGRNVLTVASYRAERKLPNGTTILGQLSSFSSHGPSVDGRRKPDIAGPGQNVVSSVSSFDPGAGNPTEQVLYNGKTYAFVPYSGTSMSGPAVCGIVALMLEQNPGLSQEEVKTIIQKTRRLDDFTGQIGDSGSLVWGMGKANALHALMETITYPVMKPREVQHLLLFPNPGTSTVKVEIKEQGTIRVYNLKGQKLMEQMLESMPTMTHELDFSQFVNGMYFIEFETSHHRHFSKWMKTEGF